jgi:hypothetical protein
VKIYCCLEFDRAREVGSDSEGYGRLIHHWDGKYVMGTDMLPILYCPWCGYEIEEFE